MFSASEEAIAQAGLSPGPHAVVSADREGINAPTLAQLSARYGDRCPELSLAVGRVVTGFSAEFPSRDLAREVNLPANGRRP